MKALIGIIVLALLGFGAYSYFGESNQENVDIEEGTEETETVTENPIVDGDYVVDIEESRILWSGKKPLLDEYINSGLLLLSSGTVSIQDTMTSAEFTIDMNSLSASETRAKPGAESLLSEHLKSERWFNVETYPEAMVTIASITPTQDENEAQMYTVEGTLTMKGVTEAITFPAKVYLDENGLLHADAIFEIDRTKWEITAGSNSFFDNLADQVIDDMIGLSLTLVASPGEIENSEMESIEDSMEDDEEETATSTEA